MNEVEGGMWVRVKSKTAREGGRFRSYQFAGHISGGTGTFERNDGNLTINRFLAGTP
ncbi:MAG: hypothetical protein H7176_14100 [Bdellovibrionales bacterium]|nr:hypothetical protein [Massilia sp.]